MSTVVTIAEPRCLLGRHAVSPATALSTLEALYFFFSFFLNLPLLFLFSSTWHCDSFFQTAVACEKSSPAFVRICERGKSRTGGSWQLLCAPTLRWQMYHTVRAVTCLAAANSLTAALFVTCLLSFCLVFFFSFLCATSSTADAPI